MKKRQSLMFLILFAGFSTAYSQNIQMNLELYEGSNIETMVLSNMEWLCISLPENQELSVEISYYDLSDMQKPLPAFYLNDGTSNFAGALPFPGSRTVFPVNKNRKPIQNNNSRPQRLSFWIGLPPNQTREIAIEYN